MSKQRKRDTQPLTPPAADRFENVTVWRALHSLRWNCYGGEVGYLVTEPGNPQLPIAFVFEIGSAEDEKAYDAAIEFAGWISKAPELITDGRRRVLDLRGCARKDSPCPVPGWMYGLTLEATDGKSVIDEENELPFQPFCRFLFKNIFREDVAV